MTYLKHNKADIAFIQETHFVKEEADKLKRGWVGHIYHSSFSSQRNGVIILVNKNLNFVLLKEVKDDEGRMICIQALVNGTKVTLCNIYAPNKCDPNFFHEVNKTLGEMEGQIILAGDFNQVSDPFLDRSKYSGPRIPKDRAAMHMISEDLGLVDIWRLINHSEREYTFFSHCQQSYSRIDMFLISSTIIKQVANCKINPMALSDHAAVELNIDINSDTERKGRWRMNTSLLQDESFKLTLRNDLISFFEINAGSTDTRAMEWEASKAYIRGKIIAHSSKKKKEDMKRIKDLETEIRDLEIELAKHFSDQTYRAVCKLKFQLQEIYNKKVQYALFRLGTTFYEGGEKTGKLLARQLKQRNSQSAIPAIKKGDKIVSSTKEINEVLQQFYKELYTSDINPTQEELTDFFSNINLPKLTPDQVEVLDNPITENEIRTAISGMKSGKSPGLDGFPVEYYKQYIDILAPLLQEVYNEAFKLGSLPSTFNEALISVIPKKDRDTTNPANYRPLSLINLDCKILTKILAIRLEKALSSIIHPDQVGFMKNRSSTDNMRRLLHLIWLNRTETDPVVALSLDAEKAFDRVHWEFLFAALSHFGFGTTFIKWIKTIYKNPKAVVITNGVISPPFNLTRATRQGCALSPLLFNIVLEPLAIAIRSNAAIKGIEGGGKEHKLLLYADDILLLVKDPLNSVPNLMNTIQSYSKLSGYKINWTKSEAMPISGLGNSNLLTNFGFKWISKGMMYLGIRLSRKVEEMPALNLEPVLQKIKTNLDKWGKLRLTLWGKVNVLKMVVAPQFNYVLMMLPVTIPPQIFKQYDTITKEFLWEKKRPRIKLSKMCAPRDRGGLALPDPRLYYISFEMAKLAKHYKTDEQLEWITIESKLSSPFTPIDRLSQCSHNVLNPIMSHSKEIWTKIHKMYKISHCKQVYSSLWHNPLISIGKTSVYWKDWHLNGLCHIADLYEEKVFLSFSDIKRKYNLNGKGQFWKYLQIRDCVTTRIQQQDGNHIMDYLTLPAECHRASLFYKTANQLLSDDCRGLKAIWERDLGFVMEEEEWLKIISDNGKYIREARGKFTQYKLIHRYYWTPQRLNRAGIMDNNLCWKCQKDIGTLLHCIWECPVIQPFWKTVLDNLSNWLGRDIPLCPRLCLLGDKTRALNTTNSEISVIMAGITTAARTILKHWKTPERPDLKEWVNAMAKTASYELMLNRVDNRGKNTAAIWDSFWTHITSPNQPVA